MTSIAYGRIRSPKSRVRVMLPTSSADSAATESRSAAGIAPNPDSGPADRRAQAPTLQQTASQVLPPPRSWLETDEPEGIGSRTCSRANHRSDVSAYHLEGLFP